MSLKNAIRLIVSFITSTPSTRAASEESVLVIGLNTVKPGPTSTIGKNGNSVATKTATPAAMAEIPMAPTVTITAKIVAARAITIEPQNGESTIKSSISAQFKLPAPSLKNPFDFFEVLELEAFGFLLS